EQEKEETPFFTMELLHGETLHQRIERMGRIPTPETTALVRQIVAGLGAIHQAGIVHRDLKTENVFVVPDEAGLRAVIVDFGLARAVDGSIVSTSPTAKVLAGTRSCMAPEQAQGGRVDAAADVFALGVLIFEMVTARRAFATDPAFRDLRQGIPLPS